MTDMADIIKLANTAQAFEAAKYGGGYAGGNGLLDIAINAYKAAYPKAPAANLLAGGRHAYNLNKYNQALYQEKQNELTRQAKTRELMGKHYGAMGIPVDIDGDGVNDNLDLEQYKQLAEVYGNQQGNAGLANFANGKDPSFGALAPMERVQKFYQDEIFAPNRTAQEREDYFRRINQTNPNQATQAPPENLPPIDYGDGTTVLQGNANRSVVPPHPITPMQRALGGLYPADPKLITDSLTQKETARHNQTTEAETKRQFDKKFPLEVKDSESRRISALKSGGGGSGNPYTIPNAMQTNVKGRISSIEDELKSMGYIDSHGKISNNLRRVSKDPTVIRAQQLAAERALLQSQIGVRQPTVARFSPAPKAATPRKSGNTTIRGTKGNYEVP